MIAKILVLFVASLAVLSCGGEKEKVVFVTEPAEPIEFSCKRCVCEEGGLFCECDTCERRTPEPEPTPAAEAA